MSQLFVKDTMLKLDLEKLGFKDMVVIPMRGRTDVKRRLSMIIENTLKDSDIPSQKRS